MCNEDENDDLIRQSDIASYINTITKRLDMYADVLIQLGGEPIITGFGTLLELEVRRLDSLSDMLCDECRLRMVQESLQIEALAFEEAFTG